MHYTVGGEAVHTLPPLPPRPPLKSLNRNPARSERSRPETAAQARQLNSNIDRIQRIQRGSRLWVYRNSVKRILIACSKISLKRNVATAITFQEPFRYVVLIFFDHAGFFQAFSLPVSLPWIASLHIVNYF